MFAMSGRNGAVRRLGSLLVVATMVTACGGAASPSPSTAPASPSAIASSSPSPSVDVAAEFVKQISTQLSGTLEVTGEMTLTGPDGDVVGDVTGEMAVRGSDNRSRMTFDLLGQQQTTEQVRLGQDAWSRTAPGPWLEDTSPRNDESLGEILEAMTTVEDLGPETRDGRELHHLRPAGGSEITPGAMGLDNESITEAEATMEFYAEPDGTPAIMAITASWVQVSAGQEIPVEMVLDFAFTGLGETVTIEAPDDVWELHTSGELGYSMAHPADWTVEAGDVEDAYKINGQAFIYVTPQSIPGGTTMADFHASLLDVYDAQLGGQPESDDAVTLGGVQARRLLYHFTNANNVEVALVDYLAVQGGKGWEVFIATEAGASEPEDVELFETFVASFKFAE